MRETLIQYVQRIMRQKNLTLRNIEENSGGKISNSYISKILNGNVKNPTADKIVALAKGLKVDAHEVFSAISGQEQAASNPMVFADMVKELASDPTLQELLQEWLRMPAKERKTMLQAMRFVNKQREASKNKKER
jgi:transcriptional regulator with XRE-family HTH domain